MQLLRTILIIVLVYYMVKLFVRFVLPFIARYFIRKSFSNFQNQKQTTSKKEGEINVDYTPKKKNLGDDLGEYIDYEEVNDKK
ncbi:MAG: DUF4834 family protein [Bacteroidales bacterium]|nr:DUF4834 family protein [Bacteroidales bacterium]